MNRTADRQALDWLGRGIEATGYDTGSWWDASAWILHAMYETAELPAGIELLLSQRVLAPVA